MAMRKNRLWFAGIVLAVVVALLVLSGGYLPSREGFAIYLTEGDIPPAQMPALSHVEIEERPVIAMDDVITYNAQTHELEVAASAYEDVFELDVPVSGMSFLVCVDREPIYWGAFWTPISSMSFDGVTIWKPMATRDPKVLTLELGYPSSSFYGGEDPRNDPRVLRSLEQAGKLITKLSIETVDELPESMKGYELYSWLQDGQWHFTLITGTNRNKALEEVISEEDFISRAGWVRVHVVGVDAIKAVLDKIPEGEQILWLAGLRGQTSEGSVDIGLPEEPVVVAVSEYAIDRGLEFMAQTSPT
jgi:hypothetical protein